MRSKPWLAGVGLFLASQVACADTDFREVILDAMRAENGRATAYVDGPVADQLRAAVQKPSAQVLLEVSTVGKLAQAGCRRMALRFSTPGALAPTADGKGAPLAVGMQLNMCPDGMPPSVVGEKAAP